MKKNLHILLAAWLMVLLWLPAVGIAGVAVEGVIFPAVWESHGQRLELKGVGLFRYMVFIKAYVGALYAVAGTPPEQILADRAKRLEVQYFHPISGEDFGPVTTRAISRNVSADVLARIRPQIDRHNALYRDVQPGDRYALTYIPGWGTELALNGEPLGVIPGAEFAAAVFSIWLGPQPLSTDFKEALLGRI
ncbi:MAG: chalcone isomerase family protein [Desulfobacterales bacterium]